jgi:hypothetical protein
MEIANVGPAARGVSAPVTVLPMCSAHDRQREEGLVDLPNLRTQLAGRRLHPHPSRVSTVWAPSQHVEAPSLNEPLKSGHETRPLPSQVSYSHGLVAALRRAARERGGPLPSIDLADALLDERRELNAGLISVAR